MLKKAQAAGTDKVEYFRRRVKVNGAWNRTHMYPARASSLEKCEKYCVGCQ